MNTTEAILRAMVKCSAWWQRRGINTSDGTCDVGAHAANGSGAADLFAPDCLIDDWDPIAVLAEEEKAYDMLYSDLDEEQQRIYDELVSAGVLPDRTVNRVTD